MADSRPKQAGNAQAEAATSPWTEPFQRAQTTANPAARPEQRSNNSASAQHEADSARATQDALSVIFNRA